MPPKDNRLLRVGVLGCGPIAQAAHFESCTKACNAELYAICDVADDLSSSRLLSADHCDRLKWSQAVSGRKRGECERLSHVLAAHQGHAGTATVDPWDLTGAQSRHKRRCEAHRVASAHKVAQAQRQLPQDIDAPPVVSRYVVEGE